ncbi:surface lipoprotein assembly modifier [Sphingomonas cannabina]|uniref:surface lipoprotein assembly modifier n=1 Tax=Sphingomonas cannabina TaxID=2899123 RepID=UPI001F1C2E12|nr:surface lipoprotein assembly modifier [Sphingomonas cannabina]UIJ47233.1 surface lipoprotein assembly modifier [Sphingomonas cannabina]
MRCLALIAAMPLILSTPPAAAQEAVATAPASLQLLAQAEALVQAKRFADAEPLIAALSRSPEMRLQARFLAGYAAAEQGDYKRASELFKAILADNPGQTRVRLELARALIGLGKTASADRQLRIAQQDDDLPPDLARIIRGVREVIRSQRPWRLDMDFGIAPDSNINGATSADRITIQLGEITLPVALDDSIRARSGTGQVASLNAGVRLPVSGKTAMLVDLNGSGSNYRGSEFDDYLVQLAAGPQLNLSDDASLFGQLVGAQRWYGGRSVTRQIGTRLGGQLAVADKTRLGIQFDARRTTALFDRAFSGWQLGLYANAERSVSQSLVVTGGLFARRDLLRTPIYSNAELGGSLGLGGSLPLGISFVLNGVVSHASYDAPLTIFSPDPRKDWRLSGGLSLGARKFNYMGFSPSVQLSYSRTESTLPFFASDRLRLRLALARYF